MTEKDIKAIPKYILDEIYKRDLKIYPWQEAAVRFYAYLSIWKKTRESDRCRYETKETMVLQTGRHPRHTFRPMLCPRYGIQLYRVRLPHRLVRRGITILSKTVRGRQVVCRRYQIL